MSRTYVAAFRRIVCCIVVLTSCTGLASDKQSAKVDREQARTMLRLVADDVEKHYYDPKLHGIDWRARVQQARKNVETAQSMDDVVSEIAALLDGLHDTHTYIALPPRTNVHDYGFQMEMIGDRCYVVRVRAGSDAGVARARNQVPGDDKCSDKME